MTTATPDNPTLALSGAPLLVLDASHLAPAKRVPSAEEGLPEWEEVPTDEAVGEDEAGKPVFGTRKVPVHVYDKEIAHVGDWVHRASGEDVLITPERIAEWQGNFDRLKASGVFPFLPDKHTDVFDSAANNGQVMRVWRDGDGWYGRLKVVGSKAIEKVLKSDVSIGIKQGPRTAFREAGKPVQWDGEFLHHVSLVPEGGTALPHLGKWARVKLAASADGADEIDVKVFEQKPAAAPVRLAPSRLALALGTSSSRLALALAGAFTESKHPRDHGRFARALGAASVATPGRDRPGYDPAAGFGEDAPDADHPSVRAVLARADAVAGNGGPSGPQVVNLARTHYATDASARAAFGDREAFAAAARKAHEDRSGVARAKTGDLAHRPTGSLVIEGRALRAKPDKTPAEHARLRAIGKEIEGRGTSPKDWWETPENRARHRAFRAGMRQAAAWPEGTTSRGVALAADAGLRGIRGRLAAMLAGPATARSRSVRGTLALALCGGDADCGCGADEAYDPDPDFLPEDFQPRPKGTLALALAAGNCGTGDGGFAKGNTCAGEGHGARNGLRTSRTTLGNVKAAGATKTREYVDGSGRSVHEYRTADGRLFHAVSNGRGGGRNYHQIHGARTPVKAKGAATDAAGGGKVAGVKDEPAKPDGPTPEPSKQQKYADDVMRRMSERLSADVSPELARVAEGHFRGLGNRGLLNAYERGDKVVAAEIKTPTGAWLPVTVQNHAIGARATVPYAGKAMDLATMRDGLAKVQGYKMEFRRPRP